jgi:hypothetical protein
MVIQGSDRKRPSRRCPRNRKRQQEEEQDSDGNLSALSRNIPHRSHLFRDYLGTSVPGLHRSRVFGEACQVLWTIFVILLILWLVGFIGFHVMVWYVHVLLVIAIAVLVIQLISGRRGSI